jgi:hypothetical protein
MGLRRRQRQNDFKSSDKPMFENWALVELFQGHRRASKLARHPYGSAILHLAFEPGKLRDFRGVGFEQNC